MTALSTSRPEAFGDDRGDLVPGEVARASAGSLDKSVQVVVREIAGRLVDLL